MIGASTRLAAVVGWPIGHSRSPALHNAAFQALGLDAVFVALEVAWSSTPATLMCLLYHKMKPRRNMCPGAPGCGLPWSPLF